MYMWYANWCAARLCLSFWIVGSSLAGHPAIWVLHESGSKKGRGYKQQNANRNQKNKEVCSKIKGTAHLHTCGSLNRKYRQVGLPPWVPGPTFKPSPIVQSSPGKPHSQPMPGAKHLLTCQDEVRLGSPAGSCWKNHHRWSIVDHGNDSI
jgi:hypothetical protein